MITGDALLFSFLEEEDFRKLMAFMTFEKKSPSQTATAVRVEKVNRKSIIAVWEVCIKQTLLLLKK